VPEKMPLLSSGISLIVIRAASLYYSLN